MSPERPVSGSRWEPAVGPTPAPADSAGGTGAPPPARPRRRKALVALAAVALLAIGGLGGYWIGHASAASASPSGQSVPFRHRDGGQGRDGLFGSPDGDGGQGSAAAT